MALKQILCGSWTALEQWSAFDLKPVIGYLLITFIEDLFMQPICREKRKYISSLTTWQSSVEIFWSSHRHQNKPLIICLCLKKWGFSRGLILSSLLIVDYFIRPVLSSFLLHLNFGVQLSSFLKLPVADIRHTWWLWELDHVYLQFYQPYFRDICQHVKNVLQVILLSSTQWTSTRWATVPLLLVVGFACHVVYAWSPPEALFSLTSSSLFQIWF